MVPRKLRAPSRARRSAGRVFRRRSPFRKAALEQGWRLDRSELFLLEVLERRLGKLLRPKVAVLTSGAESRVAALVEVASPEAILTVVDASNGPESAHVELAAAGRFDVVIDDKSAMPAPKLFVVAFLHLDAGGVYLAIGRKARLGRLLRRLDELRRASATPATAMTSRRERDEQALGAAVESIEQGPGLVVVTNRISTLAKVYDGEIDRILSLRPNSPDKLVHSLPGQSLKSRCTLTRSDGERGRSMPDLYEAPPVTLRDYRDVVCLPGQVVTKDNLLLPDTFRHNQRKRLHNMYTEEVARRFASLPQLDETSADSLAGTYFYLDNEIRGHFGHAITEQVSRLWAVPVARQIAPDLKAVLAVNTRPELQAFEYELYGTMGFEPEDLVLLPAATRVERLLAATPMFSMPQYVHPAVAQTWTVVGDALAATAPDRPYPRKIFVSRRLSKRACLNTAEVEDVFAAHGFSIIYPEDFPLGEQVEIFRRAEVIGGFAGSGLFHICFAEDPKVVIMLAHASYTATNEYMMASVRGHQIFQVISQPDLEEARRLQLPGDFQSPFRVDFQEEGQFLLKLLANL